MQKFEKVRTPVYFIFTNTIKFIFLIHITCIIIIFKRYLIFFLDIVHIYYNIHNVYEIN